MPSQMEIPDEFLEGAVFVPKPTREQRANWLIIYFPELSDHSRSAALIEDQLKSFKHTKCFVFQLERDKDEVRACIALTLDGGKHDPRFKLKKIFKNSYFYFVENIEIVRRYCLRTNARLTEPCFHGFTGEEETRYQNKYAVVIKRYRTPKELEALEKSKELGISTSEGIAKVTSLYRENVEIPSKKERAILELSSCDIGLVYLLRERSTNIYKIGTSSSIFTRIASLRSKLGVELDLVAVCQGSYSVESFMHANFRSEHFKGREWFLFDDNDVKKATTLFEEMRTLYRANREAKRLSNLTKEEGEENVFPDNIAYLHRRRRKVLGPIMKQGEKTKYRYPECPGEDCWCYDCAMLAIQKYFPNKKPPHDKKEAIRWASSRRSSWGWLIEKAYYDDRVVPSYEKESIKEGKGKYNVKVVASWISRDIIAFKCPFCRTCYNVDGTPYEGSKEVMHYYENAARSIGDDFVITRPPQCERQRFAIPAKNIWSFPQECANFSIHVTEATARKILRNKKKKVTAE